MHYQTQADTRGSKITLIARKVMAITLVIATDIAMVIVVGIVIIHVTQAVALTTILMNLRIMALHPKVILVHLLWRVQKTSFHNTSISIILWSK